MKKIKRNKLISGGASEPEGRWITKNGARIFIKNKRLYEDKNEAPKMEQGGWFDGAGSEDERKQGNPLIDEALIAELKRRKEKFYEEDILFITKDKTGQIVWLEEGNNDAGFKHINNRHKKDFENKDPTIKSKADLVGYIYDIFTKGKVECSIINKRKNREGYDRVIKYNGIYFFLSAVGTNGFITSIFPISQSEAKRRKERQRDEKKEKS